MRGESGPMDDSQNALARARAAVAGGLGSGLKTSLYLLRIMVPVSLAVALLKWCGALDWAARFMAPAMGFVGLPGEASLVIVSSMLLNVYSAVAVIETLPLTMREITILAALCLSAHNLIIETAVMRKSGSSAVKMLSLRILGGFALAYALNLLLPRDAASAVASAAGTARAAFMPMLGAWGLSTLRLVVKILLLVNGIMIAQRLMEAFHVLDFLSKLAAPLMRVFGLSENSSFLWIVINVVGYAYGAAIIMERVQGGAMKPQEADLFNHHACLCHSLLEDTSLFLAIGAPLGWITLPRIAAALLVVWLERFRRGRFRRSFKAGTA